MKFWNILKYVLMVLFFLILMIGFAQTSDTKEAQQPVPQVGQSKFNF